MKKLSTIVVMLLGTMAMKAQLPAYLPTNGLVGWYPFNGNANDESGLGTNGNIINAISSSDRFNSLNSAYTFNGNNSVIDLGVNSSINSIVNDLSFSYWVKLDLGSPQPRNTVLASYSNQLPYGSWRFISSIDRVNLSAYSGVAINGTTTVFWNNTNSNQNTIQFNQWCHVVHTKAGSVFKTYINGVLLGSYNISSPNINNPNSPPATTKIGHNWPSQGSPEWFKGSIDDIGIWNRALTPQEIAELYSGCQSSVSAQPANQTTTVNNPAQFSTSSTDPSATFQWQSDVGFGFQNLNNVGQYSGVNTNTLTVSNVSLSNNNQPFRCIITSGSCSDTSQVAVLTVNNNMDTENWSNAGLVVYPNPAQDHMVIKVNPSWLGSSYVIMDAAGRTLYHGQLNALEETISLKTFSPGVYLVKVGDKFQQYLRVIKE